MCFPQNINFHQIYGAINFHQIYGAIIFDSANQGLLGQLDKIHYRAALTVSGCIQGTSTQKVLRCLHWMSLEDRRKEKKIFFMYDYSLYSLPPYLSSLVQSYVNLGQDDRLRYVRKFVLSVNMSDRFRKYTVPSAIKVCETVPISIKQCYTWNSFKFKTILLRGKPDHSATKRLDLNRSEEINLNRLKCDLIF
jgi:hypothetical protein